MEMEVLRLSSRAYRDLRITTHVALVTRAFGGTKMYLPAGASSEIEKTVNGITKRFGGTFQIETYERAGALISKKKKEGFAIAHLTMYGELLSKVAPALRREKKILIVVGADKVPAEIYHLADFNISVTNQPHSEVAALGVTLHEIMGGKEESLPFRDAGLKIIPTARGKKTWKRKSVST